MRFNARQLSEAKAKAVAGAVARERSRSRFRSVTLVGLGLALGSAIGFTVSYFAPEQVQWAGHEIRQRLAR